VVGYAELELISSGGMDSVSLFAGL
jgi:hypothetical protein